MLTPSERRRSIAYQLGLYRKHATAIVSRTQARGLDTVDYVSGLNSFHALVFPNRGESCLAILNGKQSRPLRTSKIGNCRASSAPHDLRKFGNSSKHNKSCSYAQLSQSASDNPNLAVGNLVSYASYFDVTRLDLYFLLAHVQVSWEQSVGN